MDYFFCKTIILCMAFTYCAIVSGFCFNNLEVTHHLVGEKTYEKRCNNFDEKIVHPIEIKEIKRGF